MICPNCGRVIEVGEICECQALSVAKRDTELAQEAEENRENDRLDQERKKKEKSDKIKDASKKADKAADSAMNFGKKMVEYFKNMDKIDEMYMEKETAQTALTLIIIHAVLNILLVYLALNRSPLGLSFMVVSVFESRVGTAITVGSVVIALLPVIIKTLLMKMVSNEKELQEVSSEYIFTIPATLASILVCLVSPNFSLAFMLAIIIFGSMWTASRLENNGMKKQKAMLIAIGAVFIMSLLTIIICALIA